MLVSDCLLVSSRSKIFVPASLASFSPSATFSTFRFSHALYQIRRFRCVKDSSSYSASKHSKYQPHAFCLPIHNFDHPVCNLRTASIITAARAARDLHRTGSAEGWRRAPRPQKRLHRRQIASLTEQTFQVNSQLFRSMTARNCSVKVESLSKECVLGKTFSCISSSRGTGLVDVFVRSGCRGLFSCGGYSEIYCGDNGESNSTCFCPPSHQQAKAAVMMMHGTLPSHVKWLILENRSNPASLRPGEIHLGNDSSSWAQLPARPPGCEDRLVPSPLLSTESEGALRVYQKARAVGFRQRAASFPKLLSHVRRGRAPLATRRYRTCAVVGSSSNLLDHEDGDRIDAAEVVFRMAHAPTSSHLSKHIGSRTDIYVDSFYVRPAGAELCPSGKKNAEGNCTGPATDQQILRCGAGNLACIKHAVSDKSEGKWDRTSPGLEMYAQSLLYGAGKLPKAGKYPSTGFIAILLALHRCDLTTVFGFGFSNKQRCAKYYQTPKQRRCRPSTYLSDLAHNMPLEHAWLRLLTENYTKSALTCHQLPRAV
eukprot:6183461-Pleurochrysis_carterae.AAC.9